MHAHICSACLKERNDHVIWIHGDDGQGDILKHACPKCGGLIWQKWLVPVAQIPNPNRVPQQAGKQNVEVKIMMLSDVILVFLFGALFIGAYFTWMRYAPQIIAWTKGKVGKK